MKKLKFWRQVAKNNSKTAEAVDQSAEIQELFEVVEFEVVEMPFRDSHDKTTKGLPTVRQLEEKMLADGWTRGPVRGN